MSDREKDPQDLVGIRHEGKALCLNCAGFKRNRAGDKMDRILRKDVEDRILNFCERCGRLLI